MSFFSRALLSCLLLSISHSVWAIGLADSLIPASIKASYKTRQLEPLTCIKSVTQFIDKVAALPPPVNTRNSENLLTNNKRVPNNAPTHLLASCYIELENYEKSLSLLMPLLKNPSATPDEIRTLNLIASEIPDKTN